MVVGSNPAVQTHSSPRVLVRVGTSHLGRCKRAMLTGCRSLADRFVGDEEAVGPIPATQTAGGGLVIPPRLII